MSGEQRIRDDILDANPNFVVVRSVSKTYNVPGIRLGIAVSSQAVFIRDIRRGLVIWNINSFGEFFLQIAPKYAVEYRSACRDMADERERGAAALAGMPFLAPLPSKADYILCALTGGWMSEKLAAHLLCRHDVYLKSFFSRQRLEGCEYVRNGIKLPEDNQFLVQCLVTVPRRGAVFPTDSIKNSAGRPTGMTGGACGLSSPIFLSATGGLM